MPLDLEAVVSGLESALGKIDLETHETPLPALFAFGRDDSAGKHDIVAADRPSGRLDCYLGIDVGSRAPTWFFRTKATESSVSDI